MQPPIQGSSLAAVAKHLGTILRPTAATKALSSKSEYIFDLAYWYLSNVVTVRQTAQITFYETKSMRGLVDVVDRASAGFTGQRAIPVENADHSSICKIDSPFDGRFMLVKRFIQENLSASEASSNVPHNHNLPLLSNILGRQEDLYRLQARLTSDQQHVVVEGFGGNGKTTMALALAHKTLADGQYDHAVWVSDRDESVTIINILDEIATTLGAYYVTAQNIEDKRREINSLLKSNKVIVVIDNFDTVAALEKESIVAFFRNASAHCRAIFTCRPSVPHSMLRDRSFSLYELNGLDRSSSSLLIEQELDRMAISSLAPHDLEKLKKHLPTLTSGNPLAIILSVSAIKEECIAVDRLLDMLKSAEGDIFQILFSEVWKSLSKDERTLLCNSSMFVDSFSEEALFSTTETVKADFDKYISSLARLRWFQPFITANTDSRRFEIHPLTLAFCRRKFSAQDKRHTAHLNLSQHFLDFTGKFRSAYWEGEQVYDDLGPVDKRDSQKGIDVIQDFFLGGSSDAWRFVGCGMGIDRVFAAA